MRRLLAMLLAGCLPFAAVAAPADDYPAHPVTIIVPFAPGGATDLLARLVGGMLELRLGKGFVIDNKPGAGTVIGANAAAKAAPDGYTLFMATSTPLAINATLYKNLPYKPASDFIPVAAVAQVPFVLVVNPSLPVNSVAELIAYAKANPGRLSFGSAGAGSPHHLYMELFNAMAGTQMTHVPYKGSLPALNDVIAGHIQLMFCDLPPVMAQLPSGNVRALGVSTKKRIPGFESIAPIAEVGLPGFEAMAWQMLVAPAKTPQDIVEKLHADIKSFLETPEIEAQIVKVGMIPMPNPPVAELHAFVQAEIDRWGKVVTRAGLAGRE